MKASEVRPCDACRGPIAPVCYEVSVRPLALDGQAARSTLGLNTMFGGALGLAEALSPDPEVMKPSGEPVTVLLCTGCYAEGRVAEAAEVREDGRPA